MSMTFTDLSAQLKAKTAIDADDTLAARRLAWPDGKIDPAEADAIFDLNTLIKDKAPEWVEFYVEAICEYVVHQQVPRGYVDDTKSDWLVAKIDADGRVDSLGELELLVKILETATNVPDRLKTYALVQIEQIVLTGAGPTRDGGSLDVGSISDAEVKLLRRILFAQGGDGPGKISRAEADILFRIKDATLGANNSAAWQKLFVQAVGNHLMAHSDYQPLARNDAVRLDAFMNDNTVSVGGFFSRMFKVSARGAANEMFESDPVVQDHTAKVLADRAIAADEKSWLDISLDKDAARDPLEEALLSFIAEESANKSAY